MLVYAGIDEAGYGPVVGPLCVACSAFVVGEMDDADGVPPDLWSLLRYAVSRAGGDGHGRIAVDDSKKLKGANNGPGHPLRRLERGVLAFCQAATVPCAPAVPCCDADLFDLLGATVPNLGWYGETNPVPAALTTGEIRIDIARLRRHLDRAGVQFGFLACEAIDAAEFNQQVDRMGNKAAVNFCAVLRLIDRVWKSWPDASPHIAIDRQGGRQFYREPLQQAFPGAHVRILDEDEMISRYSLEQDGRTMTLSFTVDGDQHHLPTALASMTAKYVRELFMLRLNRFFQGHLPELKPTAGYNADGRRFAGEIRGLLRDLGVEPETVIRRV